MSKQRYGWRPALAWRHAAVFLASFLLLPACTSEELIFVDRPFFDDPPAGAAGFLGYVSSDALDQGRTVCGECHVGKQGDWMLAKHSSAWAFAAPSSASIR